MLMHQKATANGIGNVQLLAKIFFNRWQNLPVVTLQRHSPPRELGDRSIALQPHEREAIENRVAVTDKALEKLHAGQHKYVAEWRRLLLENEELEQRLIEGR